MAKYPPGKRPPPTPPRKQPWDMPPRADKGDAKPDTTLLAVGRAITAWEDFEQSFTHVFLAFLKVDQDSLPAKRAYGSIMTFKGRLDMVRAAAEAYFFEHTDSLQERKFKELSKGAEGFCSRRNEVAHGIVRHVFVPSRVISGGGGRMLRLSESWGHGVVPSEYATSKMKLELGETLLSGVEQTPVYTYTSADIAHFIAGFGKLKAEAIGLQMYISAWTRNVVRGS